MTDFQQVIDFLFVCLSNVWNLMVSNLVLAFSLMVFIFAMVISLVQTIKGDK